jgi:DNA-binding MarR family transcriptional regulator
VKRRLVERTPMPNNRRQLRLTVRPAGEKMLQAAIRATQFELRQRLRALPPERLRRISQAMKDLADHLAGGVDQP